MQHGLDADELRGERVDVFVARFILHTKEDEDAVLSRQGCLDLLATAQKRAGVKLRLSQQVMRLWHREEPPRQAEALPLCAAYALVTVLAQVMKRRECALHVLLAFQGASASTKVSRCGVATLCCRAWCRRRRTSVS